MPIPTQSPPKPARPEMPPPGHNAQVHGNVIRSMENMRQQGQQAPALETSTDSLTAARSKFAQPQAGRGRPFQPGTVRGMSTREARSRHDTSHKARQKNWLDRNSKRSHQSQIKETTVYNRKDNTKTIQALRSAINPPLSPNTFEQRFAAETTPAQAKEAYEYKKTTEQTKMALMSADINPAPIVDFVDKVRLRDEQTMAAIDKAAQNALGADFSTLSATQQQERIQGYFDRTFSIPEDKETEHTIANNIDVLENPWFYVGVVELAMVGLSALPQQDIKKKARRIATIIALLAPSCSVPSPTEIPTTEAPVAYTIENITLSDPNALANIDISKVPDAQTTLSAMRDRVLSNNAFKTWIKETTGQDAANMEASYFSYQAGTSEVGFWHSYIGTVTKESNPSMLSEYSLWLFSYMNSNGQPEVRLGQYFPNAISNDAGTISVIRLSNQEALSPTQEDISFPNMIYVLTQVGNSYSWQLKDTVTGNWIEIEETVGAAQAATPEAVSYPGPKALFRQISLDIATPTAPAPTLEATPDPTEAVPSATAIPTETKPPPPAPTEAPRIPGPEQISLVSVENAPSNIITVQSLEDVPEYLHNVNLAFYSLDPQPKAGFLKKDLQGKVPILNSDGAEVQVDITQINMRDCEHLGYTEVNGTDGELLAYIEHWAGAVTTESDKQALINIVYTKDYIETYNEDVNDLFESHRTKRNSYITLAEYFPENYSGSRDLTNRALKIFYRNSETVKITDPKTGTEYSIDSGDLFWALIGGGWQTDHMPEFFQDAFNNLGDYALVALKP